MLFRQLNIDLGNILNVNFRNTKTQIKVNIIEVLFNLRLIKRFCHI